MRKMGVLRDFFFGKMVRIKDPILGDLETRVKGDNITKVYTWTSEHLIPGQLEKTVFILEGNLTGPYKSQLQAVYRIIYNLQDLIQTVDLKIKNTKPTYNQYWSTQYYLAAITPVDVEKSQFEVCFDSLAPGEGNSVSFFWENDVISEISAG